MASHTWEQTNKEVALLLPVPPDVRGKEVRFQCTSQQLSVSVRDVEVRGELFLPVKPDDSTWELEDEPSGRRLRVGLCKAKPNHKWDCCFLHEVDVSAHACTLVGSRQPPHEQRPPTRAGTHRPTPTPAGLDHASRLPGPDHRRAAGGTGRHRAVRQRCPQDGRELSLSLHRRCDTHGPCSAQPCSRRPCAEPLAWSAGERGKASRKKSAPQLHYRGVALHRIVPNFLVQGGDVTKDPHGLGGHSIYGATFDDEGFPIKHRGEGELLMANAGRPHNNHSQFAITMGRVKEFESGYVIFGRVLSGIEFLRVAELEGSADGFTSRPVVVQECGELDARGEPIEEVGNS